mgnify:CR=1 FL=1
MPNFSFTVDYQHRIRFTHDVFHIENLTLREVLNVEQKNTKIIVLAEDAILEVSSNLGAQINNYFQALETFDYKGCYPLNGGEASKQNFDVLKHAWDIIEAQGVDRHSYVVAIGGGAFLDVIGLACATAHRGVRLVRFPTTTLAQDDSGVGVKNAINAFGKKNFLGSFAVPYAVINDFSLLQTLPLAERRHGLIEAIKVALVKDADFFNYMINNAESLAKAQGEVFETVIEQSAILHAKHICEGGDAFEQGNSRPLDYGHWAAHKLEQLSDFELSHAQAVSIGLCLDTLYAVKLGWFDISHFNEIVQLVKLLDLPVWHPACELLDAESEQLAVIAGLNEFREHLGGELNILLLKGVGIVEEVQQMDTALIAQCFAELKELKDLV